MPITPPDWAACRSVPDGLILSAAPNDIWGEVLDEEDDVMKKYPMEKLRNLGLISHGGAGKTSLAEAMLFNAGASDRLGRVDEGSTVMDYDPDEIARQMSINTSLAFCEWQGFQINIIDTPGYFDFVGDVKAGLRAADAALVLVEAVSGVEVGTELVWRYADEYGIPRMIVINKLDRENANFDRTVAQLQEAFGDKVVPLQIPIGAEASFRGVVDVLQEKAFVWHDGKGPNEEDVPADLAAEMESFRESLMEKVAESDDELLEKYLEGEPLTGEEIIRGLRSAVLSGDVVPVLCVSALRNIGVQTLMDAVTNLLPSPADVPAVEGTDPKKNEGVKRAPKEDEPFSALVFKTMADPFVGKLTLFRVYSGSIKSDSQIYNASKGRTERIGQLFIPRGKNQEQIDVAKAGDIVAVAKLQETTTGDTLAAENAPVVFPAIKFPQPVFSVAVSPKKKGDEEKIGMGLSRLSEEDPTFKVEKSPNTGETIISGLGEMHLDVVVDRLKRKFGIEVTTEKPKVPYRETIRSSVKVEGKHKKQSGGRGQFGHVWVEFEPAEAGKDFEFVDKIFGGAVPQQYRPAVEKGIQEAMVEGILAGYPVSGIKATLYDGSYHSVDSSEMAFKIAGSMAFKKGAAQANPVLLEPIMNVQVMVPEQYMGDVMGDLNKKRGKIQGMDQEGSMQIIKAQVPQAEMFNYAIDLRSITQGRGTYTMEFSHYEEVPAAIAQQVIEERKKEE